MGAAVIIPVYNTEKYLVDCLESVIHQTVPFEQVIIINDGSTDNSLTICKKYAKKYDNIQVISKENQGQAVARNIGLSLVKSEYVMFLDSDDYIQDYSVQEVEEHMKSDDLDILYFDSSVRNDIDEIERENIYDRSKTAPQGIMDGYTYFKECYPTAYVVSPCMVAFRMEFLRDKNITFPETRIYEDIVFSFMAICNAKRVKHISSQLYVRRYREGSTITSELTFIKWEQLVYCYKKCWKFIDRFMNDSLASYADVLRLYLIITYREIKNKALEVIDREIDSKKWEDIQTIFCETWKKLDSIYFDESYHKARRICGFYRQMAENKRNVLTDFFEVEFGMSLTEAWKTYLAELNMIFEELPFKNSNAKIGIYGTGYHTEQFLKWYKHLCGKIESKIVFIDTYKNSGEVYYDGQPVINVTDIITYGVDEVIISSNDYELQMYETLRRQVGNNYPIYRFYENEDELLFLKFDNWVNEKTLE